MLRVPGWGIAIRSKWNAVGDIAQGHLCTVLPYWEVPAVDVVAMLGLRWSRTANTTVFLTVLRQAPNPAPWRRHQ